MTLCRITTSKISWHFSKLRIKELNTFLKLHLFEIGLKHADEVVALLPLVFLNLAIHPKLLDLLLLRTGQSLLLGNGNHIFTLHQGIIEL
jgi:hypothetical protein